ncbi:hypothetical protein LTR78_002299 [Recurvomyces mirabilis]|uniref:N-alkane-inducible cytochrome P450 n=1 Tax=Recurvomyces mirabilis TaxID=574656 RepID=A0AAE0WUC2_9PEZI|nr:hypothetical protein LTR78_002299 [Recurvomyces mirabilis]KAK5160754.1 hypothetical protein LTS14_001767 [Recurvomyces mirabilis]
MALLLVATVIALFIVYRATAYQLRERRFRRFALEHNCEDAPNLYTSYFAVLQRLWRLINCRRSGEDIMDDILSPDFERRPTFASMGFTGTSIVGTMDPANIQALLATQFGDFETGERRYKALAPVLGRSIFSSDGSCQPYRRIRSFWFLILFAGPFWKHSRELFRPQFSRDNINDLQATEKAVQSLFEAIEGEGATDGGICGDTDLLPLFYNLTLDTATDFLFGESVNSQQAFVQKAKSGSSMDFSKVEALASEASSEQFAEDFEVLGGGLQQRIQLQALSWLGNERKFRQAVANVHKFTEHFVGIALKSVDVEQKSKKDYLLSALANQTRDRTELRNQTLAILFAGRDTTAALLAWCMIRLTLHQEVFVRLRQVVLSEFGANGDESMTFAQLKACRPLQHFINEVLRLNPVVPFNARVAVRDTTLPVGGGASRRSPIAVRKNTNVLYSIYTMHRRKDLWGKDALLFNPGRWERRLPFSWQFVPFSGGPRICLGQQFALVETSYVLVRLLQRYDAVRAVDREQMTKMRKGIGLAMWPADGVKVKLHKARV